MYAIIETGGKQYQVSQGDIITVEKLDVAVGKKVVFDHVLCLNDGKSLKIGTPYVETPVTGRVVEHGKGDKVIIFKYKAKKDYRKKQGHRQPYTMVEITDLGLVSAPKKETKAKEAAPKKDAPAKKAVAAKKAEKVDASMKKDELIAFAADHKIAIDKNATKQVIIDAINAALK